MRRILTHTALSVALALSLGAPAALAKGKKKHSKEHYTAIRKCEDDYMAAKKEAKTKKGKERKEARADARKAYKKCVADAPQ